MSKVKPGQIPNVTKFENKDVRILRECLAWAHSKAPALVKKKIESALLQFATSVKEYCQCEERVFIQHENKFACLNCGERHKVADSPKLKALTSQNIDESWPLDRSCDD